MSVHMSVHVSVHRPEVCSGRQHLTQESETKAVATADVPTGKAVVATGPFDSSEGDSGRLHSARVAVSEDTVRAELVDRADSGGQSVVAPRLRADATLELELPEHMWGACVQTEVIDADRSEDVTNAKEGEDEVSEGSDFSTLYTWL